jgi:hypothetical protein
MAPLLLLAFEASAAKVFVAGSRVNLRASPTTKADVEGVVVIGTECTIEKRRRDWRRLRCGEHRGWTKKSLLQKTKPALDALIKKANAASTYTAGVKWAMRASALEPDNKEARKLLRKMWLGSQNELVEKGMPTAPAYYPKGRCRGHSTICAKHLFRPLRKDWERVMSGAGKTGQTFVYVAGLGEKLHIASFTMSDWKNPAFEVVATMKAESTLIAALAEGADKPEASGDREALLGHRVAALARGYWFEIEPRTRQVRCPGNSVEQLGLRLRTRPKEFPPVLEAMAFFGRRPGALVKRNESWAPITCSVTRDGLMRCEGRLYVTDGDAFWSEHARGARCLPPATKREWDERAAHCGDVNVEHGCESSGCVEHDGSCVPPSPGTVVYER